MRVLALLAALAGCAESDPYRPGSGAEESGGGRDSSDAPDPTDDSGSPDDSADSGSADDTGRNCQPEDSDPPDAQGWPEGPTTLVWTRIRFDYNGVTTEFSELRVRVGEPASCDIEQASYRARLDASGSCEQLRADAQVRAGAGETGPVVELVLSFGDDEGNWILPESGEHAWPDTDGASPSLTAYALRADWAGLLEELDCSASSSTAGLANYQSLTSPSGSVRLQPGEDDDGRTVEVNATLERLGALSVDPSAVTVCPINLFE